MDSIFTPNDYFTTFGAHHIMALICWVSAGWIILYQAKNKWSERKKKTGGIMLGILLCALVLMRIVFTTMEQGLEVKTDLPLHLCRILPFLILPMLLIQNRRLFGIIYYWIFAGSIQAIITPDLQNGFPHYDYIIYFLLHGGIVLAGLYPIWAFGFRPTFKDLKLSVIWINIYLVFTLMVNWLLGSNYFYTCQKPSVGSLLNSLGPWPWYLITGQLIGVLLFMLLYLPFHRSNNK